MEQEPKNTNESIDSMDLAQLAQWCVDSAALNGQNPHMFWGEKYGNVMANSQKYIEEIGLEKAKELAKKGELNFLENIYE